MGARNCRPSRWTPCSGGWRSKALIRAWPIWGDRAQCRGKKSERTGAPRRAGKVAYIGRCRLKECLSRFCPRGPAAWAKVAGDTSAGCSQGRGDFCPPLQVRAPLHGHIGVSVRTLGEVAEAGERQV